MKGEKGTNLRALWVTNQEDLVWFLIRGGVRVRPRFQAGGLLLRDREGQREKEVITQDSQGDNQKADTFFGLELRQDVWVGETELELQE